MTAIDVSEDALALARENAERTGLADRVSFARHDVSGRAAGRAVRPRRVQPAVRRARRSRHAPARGARLGARAGARRARRDRADRPRRARGAARGRRARARGGGRHGARRSPACSRSSAIATSWRRRISPGATASWRAGGRRSGASGGAARRAAHGHRVRALRGRGVARRRAVVRSRSKGRPEGQPAALRLRGRRDAARARPGAARGRSSERCCRGRTRSSSANPARRYPWLADGDDRRARADAARGRRRRSCARSAR